MKLLNVRLPPDDARRATHLKQQGIQLSRVVRDAIRTAYDEHVGRRRGPQRLSALIEEIYRAVPNSAPRRQPGYDLRDRRSVRRAIVTRIRRRRS